MRYAIFSDVHANRQAWEAVRADMARLQVDTLVCLGDVVGYGPMPLEVLTAVREATPNFVLGNHDAAACGRLDSSIFNDRARTVIEWTSGRLDEEALCFLQEVPLQMDGTGIQFCHAEMLEPGEFGYIDGLGPAEANLRAMTQPIGFIGHTHLPMAFTMPRKGGPVTQLPPIDFEVERGRRYIVNVGSVGEPRTTDVRASYVIYDDVERTVIFRKVAFDVEAYKADLAATGLDILPYFVQVVDAGKVAGQPAPTVAPQMALAQLPKVAEVAAGHHGRLVVGTPGAAWGSTGAGQAIRPPKSMSGGLIAMMVVLAVVVAGALVMVVGRNGDEVAGGTEGAGGGAGAGQEEPAEAKRAADRPGGTRAIGTGAPGDDGNAGPIRGLEVRVFPRVFGNLAELRSTAKEDGETPIEEVPDGFLSLDHAVGHEAVGLVWEGSLIVPETGEYSFTLDSFGGSALLLYWESVLELDRSGPDGDPVTVKVRLRRGHAPFRLEYFQGGREGGLVLEWSGPGLDGEQSLLRPSTGERPETIARTPRRREPASAPAPAPAVVHEAPEKLAKDLLAYWSFDRREEGASRFEQQDDGSVIENLVAEKGQRVHYLVPEKDIGMDWTERRFDPEGWTVGVNGVGYEEQPGGYDEFLETPIPSQRGKNPQSVYVRIPFEVKDPKAYADRGLALYLRCDDGFVAYLNGRQIAASADNLPEELVWNAVAPKSVDEKTVLDPKPIPVGRNLKYLEEGWNVLAIHGMNTGKAPGETNFGSTSSDLLIHARLVALRKEGALPAEAATVKPSPHEQEVAPNMMKGSVVPVDGRFGDACEFQDGSIEIGLKDRHAIGDRSFSLSMWFTRKPGSTDRQARRLISAGAGSATKEGWALWIAAKGDALTFAVGDGATRAEITAEDESLTSGEWRHVAVTVDRENAKVAIFLDGQLAADDAVPLLAEGTLGSQSGLSIGRNSDDKQHHRGKIDDVALWRRVLVPEEIEAIYESEDALGATFAEQAE